MPRFTAWTLAAVALLPFAAILPAAQAAGGGCTVVAPATSCMYSCAAGEYQAVVAYGLDLTARADCGYGVAQCYTGLTANCAHNGSSSTFSDTYWDACHVTPGALTNGVWVVTCTSV